MPKNALLIFWFAGIRASLYAQGALTLLIYAISPDDTIFDSWWSTLVTALSLQLAAVASVSNLTLYHAVLVTWLSFPALIMSFAFFGLFYVEGDAPFILLVLTYVHTCVFLAFTIGAAVVSLPLYPIDYACLTISSTPGCKLRRPISESGRSVLLL